MDNISISHPHPFDDRALTASRFASGCTSTRTALAQLQHYGFVVLDMPGLDSPEAEISDVAREFILGPPYVPELYRRPETAAFGGQFADITRRDDSGHPGFATDTSQPYHVDGTLEPIAEIKTSILYCRRPALSGGRTLLFNACLAFEELERIDPAAAEVLTWARTLERVSSLPGIRESRYGPAFSRGRDGLLVTRFSDGPTERWHARQGQGELLHRALSHLRSSYMGGDPKLVRGVRLETNQCLIFRNDRLSHARESFNDSQTLKRHLVRALFSAAPEEGEVAVA